MIGWGRTRRDTAGIYASAIARSDLATDGQKYLAVPRSDYAFKKRDLVPAKRRKSILHKFGSLLCLILDFLWTDATVVTVKLLFYSNLRGQLMLLHLN